MHDNWVSQDRYEQSRSLIAKDTFNRPVLNLRVGSQLRFQGSPLLVPRLSSWSCMLRTTNRREPRERGCLEMEIEIRRWIVHLFRFNSPQKRTLIIRKGPVRHKPARADAFFGKTQIFWHQSEARTAASVWNWSGKTLSQGLFSPFFTFLRALFFRPFRLSLAPMTFPW